MIKFDVLDRFSGAVQFTAEIDCTENAAYSIKLGLSVKWAYATGARLDGASLDGASLDGASLDGASLDGARLDGASLVGASLVGASLVGARLDGARLDGASLVGARLVGARLDGASLDGARLDGASLVGARLDGARLVGARLDGARLGSHTLAAGQSWAALGWPDGWYAYTFLTKENVQRVHVGCQDKTFAEGRAYWADKKDRREILAALDYAEAIAHIRGWIAS